MPYPPNMNWNHAMQHKLKSIAFMLLATALTLNLLMIALLAYTLHASYERKLAEVRTNVANIALMMEQSITGTAREVDLVLQEIQYFLNRELQETGAVREAEVDELIGARQGWISHIGRIRVSDETGSVRFAPGTLPGQFDYAHTEIFHQLRSNARIGLAISPLMQSPLTGEWGMLFARRYDNADGSFAGIIAVSVRASHFASLISELDLGPNGIALIRDLDKRLIARHPPLDAPPGHTGSVGGSAELTALLDSGEPSGTFFSEGTADGIPRTDAFRRLSEPPVMLIAGLGEADYLAIWRHDRNKAIALGMLFFLVTTLGSWLMWRQIRISHRANRRSYLLLQHASDGIHILDRDGRLLNASDSFYRMLGYPEGGHARPFLERWDVRHSEAEFRALVASCMTRPDGTTYESLFRNRDGREFPVEVSAVPLNIDGKSYLFSAARDITTRKQVEEDLRIAAQAFESQAGMMITDADLRILRCNKAFTRITGYALEDVVGRKPNLLQSGRHDRQFYRSMWHAIRTEGAWQGEVWNKRKNGEIYPQFLSIGTVCDEQGETTHYVASLADISSRKANEEQLRTLAFYDSLTKLPNRRLFLERLDQAHAAVQRLQTFGALLVVDLDDFRTLNDTEGHAAGDLLLSRVAQRLVDCVPQNDAVARLGGDEFVILLDNLGPHEVEAARRAEQVARDAMTRLGRPYRLGRSDYRGSACVGIALFGPGNLPPAQEVLRNAHLAMAQAKNTGNNSLCFFDTRMPAQVRERSDIDAGLRIALEQEQLVLHYQPQVDRNGDIIGAEALVRWHHPQQGMISPGRFIPIAEANGLILPIGHWVLETACRQLAQWAQVPALAHLTLSVNVSASQLSRRDFVERVLDVLRQTGAPAHRLKLELTESSLVHEIEEIIRKMSLLKQHGVRFSLDDFGTGYSSLSYLSRLPLDQLKIDQSFVQGMLQDANSGEITHLIMLLAERLGLAVMAEGVETEEQRAALLERGCHQFQGYLFGPPMPIEQLERELRD